MAYYLLFDRDAETVKGPYMLSPEQLFHNTNGGQLKAFELDDWNDWRTVEVKEGRLVDNYNLAALTGPLLRSIDAQADALIAPLMATVNRTQLYAAKVAEARGKGDKPLLTAEAAETGEAVADLAKKVIANAEAAREAYPLIGKIEGRKRAAKAAILALDNPIHVMRLPDVQWPKVAAPTT